MKHIRPFPPFTPAEREDLAKKITGGVTETYDHVDHAHLTKSTAAGALWTQYPCWIHAAKWEDGKGFKKFKFLKHSLYIHRASYEVFERPIPEGLLLDHLCRVHGCCQPHHLEPVSTKVNIERGANRNYLLRNGAPPPVNLTDAQVANPNGALHKAPAAECATTTEYKDGDLKRYCEEAVELDRALDKIAKSMREQEIGLVHPPVLGDGGYLHGQAESMKILTEDEFLQVLEDFGKKLTFPDHALWPFPVPPIQHTQPISIEVYGDHLQMVSEVTCEAEFDAATGEMIIVIELHDKKSPESIDFVMNGFTPRGSAGQGLRNLLLRMGLGRIRENLRVFWRKHICAPHNPRWTPPTE